MISSEKKKGYIRLMQLGPMNIRPVLALTTCFIFDIVAFGGTSRDPFHEGLEVTRRGKDSLVALARTTRDVIQQILATHQSNLK